MSIKRFGLVVAALAGFAATANAQFGMISCRDEADPEARLDIRVVNYPLVPRVIAHANLVIGDTRFDTSTNNGRINQHWLDEERVFLDIADTNGDAIFARLLAFRTPGRGDYIGTLHSGNRARQVRCRREF